MDNRIILDMEYSVKALLLLLKIQVHSETKINLYCQKESPFSLWNTDMFIKEISMEEHLSSKQTDWLKEIKNHLNLFISLESKFKKLSPINHDILKDYNAPSLFFELLKNESDIILIHRLRKVLGNSIYFNSGFNPQMEDLASLDFNKALWLIDEENTKSKSLSYEVEAYYNSGTYGRIYMKDYFSKAKNVLEEIQRLIPVYPPPFNHSYSEIQIKYIADKIYEMKRIKSKDIFCKVMLGESNVKIDWYYPSIKGNKLDIVTFCLYLKRQVVYKKMISDGPEYPAKNGNIPLAEINRVFNLPNGKVNKNGKYEIKIDNPFEIMFKNLPQ